MRKGLLLLATLCSLAGYSQRLTQDRSFGERGVATVFGGDRGNYRGEWAYNITPLPGGKFLVLVNSDFGIRMSRRLPDGKVDKTYGLGGYSDPISNFSNFPKSAMQADGKVIVGGTVDGGSSIFAVRLTTNGRIDPSFGSGGVLKLDLSSLRGTTAEVEIDNANRIILASQANSNAGNSFVVARYTASGKPDESFNGTGRFQSSQLTRMRHITVQPDNKLVVSGLIDDHLAMLRLGVDGTIDASFGNGGLVATNDPTTPRVVVMHGNNKILVGGSNSSAEFNSAFKLAQFNLDGTPDAAFGQNGSALASFQPGINNLLDISIGADGSIAACGYTSKDPSVNSNVKSDFAIARFMADGAPDNSFNGSGKAVVDFNQADDQAFAVQMQGTKVLVGGYSLADGAFINSDMILLRFNADGSRDNQFGVVRDFVPVYSSTLYALQQDNAGRVLVNGIWERYTGNGIQTLVTNFLTRFKRNGEVDRSLGERGLIDSLGNSVYAPVGDKLLIANYPSTDFSIRRINADGSPDVSYGTGGTTVVDFGGEESTTIIKQQSRQKVIAAGFSYADNGGDVAICRLDQRGKLDPSFGTQGKVKIDISGGSDDRIYFLSIASDGKIVCGGVSFGDLGLLNFVIRLTADGQPDETFGNNGRFIYSVPDATIELSGLQLQRDGSMLVLGINYSTEPLATRFISRLTRRGVLDNSFGNAGFIDANATSMVIQPNGKILAAGQQDDLYQKTILLTRYQPNGALDYSFGYGGKMTIRMAPGDERIVDMLADDEDLYVLGSNVNRVIPHFLLKYRMGYGNNREMTEEAPVVPPAFTWKVLPNPSPSSFHLLLEGNLTNDPIQLRVTDVSGRLVEAKQFTPGTVIEFGKNYQRGVYVADLTYGDKHEIVRLVKQ